MVQTYERIFTASANLIKNETISIRYKTNVYPSKVDTEFLPNCLMTALVVQGLKQPSLDQCILKAIKSKSVIFPLLFYISFII